MKEYKNLQDASTRPAILVGRSISFIATLFLVVGVYLAIQTGVWQAYAFIPLALLVMVGSLVGSTLIQRERVALGGWIILTSTMAGPLFASLLFVRLGYVALFFALITAFFIIRYVINKETRWPAIAVAAFTLVVTGMSEWLQPAWRFESQLILTISPVLTATLGLIFAVVIAREAGKINFTSMRLQMTVWMGTLIVAVSAITIGYTVFTTRQSAIETAQEEVIFIAQAQAENVYIRVAPALETAQTMATMLGVVKDAQSPTSLTREQANGILKKIAEENPSFLGTWTIWEPNAFDGLDSEYANTDLHDETGRFIPYWVKVDEETVEGVAIVDYETPGLNDWYAIPRETKQLTLIPPYIYPVNGVDVLMTTIAIPIVEDGKFYGATGVDYRVDFMQGIIDAIDLYDGSANAVLLTNDGSLVAVRNQPELALQPATSVFDDFEEIQAQLAGGKPFVSISPDGEYLRVFSPVNILPGSADWSFALLVPFSEIIAPATALALREAVISFVVILFALMVLWYLTGLLVRPFGELTSVANAITGGDFNATAEVTSDNEAGVLARAFNSMTSQLRETLASLEQRIANRTRNLELAGEVGRAVSQVQALDVMLKNACELILKEFNLYYVQVYLTDPSGSNLKLEAGTGSVGAQLVGRGHSLPLNTGSINGRAATEKRAVVIADTAQSATFKQNPLLPETRGEMAVPLIVADKVVGVLDMQSSAPDVLTTEVLPAFEALAGQFAVAIQNANLLAETEEARAQVEAQARRLVRKGWSEHLDAIHKPEQLGFVFDSHVVTSFTEADTSQLENEKAISAPIAVTGESLGSLVVEIADEARREQTNELVNMVARQVAQQIENLRLLENAERYRFEAEKTARLQTVEGWQKYITSRTADSLGYLYDTKEVLPYGNNGHGESESMFALPLKARDEKIGKLSVQGLSQDNKEEFELANMVADRLSSHIESLRLFEETKAALSQSERLFNAGERLAQSTNLQELTAASVAALGIPVVNRALLAVFNSDSNGQLESMDIVANWWNGTGHEVTAIGTRYSAEALRVLSIFTSSTPVFFDDLYNDERLDAQSLELVKKLNIRAMVSLPLFLGTTHIGSLILEAEETHNFTQDDARLFTALAPQIATLLESRRQFEQAQRQAEREAMLNAISQKIQSATTVESVLQIAARELGRAINAPFTVAQLGIVAKNGGNGNGH